MKNCTLTSSKGVMACIILLACVAWANATAQTQKVPKKSHLSNKGELLVLPSSFQDGLTGGLLPEASGPTVNVPDFSALLEPDLAVVNPTISLQPNVVSLEGCGIVTYTFGIKNLGNTQSSALFHVTLQEWMDDLLYQNTMEVEPTVYAFLPNNHFYDLGILGAGEQVDFVYVASVCSCDPVFSDIKVVISSANNESNTGNNETIITDEIGLYVGNCDPDAPNIDLALIESDLLVQQLDVDAPNSSGCGTAVYTLTLQNVGLDTTDARLDLSVTDPMGGGGSIWQFENSLGIMPSSSDPSSFIFELGSLATSASVDFTITRDFCSCNPFDLNIFAKAATNGDEVSDNNGVNLDENYMPNCDGLLYDYDLAIEQNFIALAPNGPDEAGCSTVGFHFTVVNEGLELSATSFLNFSIDGDWGGFTENFEANNSDNLVAENSDQSNQLIFEVPPMAPGAAIEFDFYNSLCLCENTLLSATVNLHPASGGIEEDFSDNTVEMDAVYETACATDLSVEILNGAINQNEDDQMGCGKMAYLFTVENRGEVATEAQVRLHYSQSVGELSWTLNNWGDSPSPSITQTPGVNLYYLGIMEPGESRSYIGVGEFCICEELEVAFAAFAEAINGQDDLNPSDNLKFSSPLTYTPSCTAEPLFEVLSITPSGIGGNGTMEPGDDIEFHFEIIADGYQTAGGVEVFLPSFITVAPEQFGDALLSIEENASTCEDPTQYFNKITLSLFDELTGIQNDLGFTMIGQISPAYACDFQCNDPIGPTVFANPFSDQATQGIWNNADIDIICGVNLGDLGLPSGNPILGTSTPITLEVCMDTAQEEVEIYIFADDFISVNSDAGQANADGSFTIYAGDLDPECYTFEANLIIDSAIADEEGWECGDPITLIVASTSTADPIMNASNVEFYAIWTSCGGFKPGLTDPSLTSALAPRLDTRPALKSR